MTPILKKYLGSLQFPLISYYEKIFFVPIYFITIGLFLI